MGVYVSVLICFVCVRVRISQEREGVVDQNNPRKYHRMKDEGDESEGVFPGLFRRYTAA